MSADWIANRLLWLIRTIGAVVRSLSDCLCRCGRNRKRIGELPFVRNDCVLQMDERKLAERLAFASLSDACSTERRRRRHDGGQRESRRRCLERLGRTVERHDKNCRLSPPTRGATKRTMRAAAIGATRATKRQNCSRFGGGGQRAADSARPLRRAPANRNTSSAHRESIASCRLCAAFLFLVSNQRAKKQQRDRRGAANFTFRH